MINKGQTLNAISYTSGSWDIVTNALDEAIDSVKSTVKESAKTGYTTSLGYPCIGLFTVHTVFYENRKKKEVVIRFKKPEFYLELWFIAIYLTKRELFKNKRKAGEAFLLVGLPTYLGI